MTELAREVLNGADLPDLQTLFADEMKVSNNSLGSLTTPSIVMVPETRTISWSDWIGKENVIKRYHKKKEVLSEGQMGLGI